MNGFIYFALIKALKMMLDTKRDQPAFTAQTDDNEIDLTFHLVMELWRPFFPWLDCSFDVIKPERNKRPDFIFHKLGIHDYNNLVVEVKRKSNAKVSNVTLRCQSDEDKIHDEWFIANLSYHYGASLVIDEENFHFAFVLFQNNPAGEKRFDSRNYQQTGLPDDAALVPIINEFIVTRLADINADTSDLEKQIETLVRQLYPNQYQ